MADIGGEKLDLSIIMPCLNEEQTVGICIDEAKAFMQENGIQGEILVVDNGSSDNSAGIAKEHGAKVICETRRGYGAAIRAGMSASSGNVLIIGDCDTTYDFLHIEGMYEMLAFGQADMVIGNRYAGGIQKGAMPLSHRCGVKFLSYLGRRKFHVNVYDFHCGLRGVTKEVLETLHFSTTGMEFATEMIAEASKQRLRIRELPVVLKKCMYPRKSKLKTIQDGFRHLIYIVRNEL